MSSRVHEPFGVVGATPPIWPLVLVINVAAWEPRIAQEMGFLLAVLLWAAVGLLVLSWSMRTDLAMTHWRWPPMPLVGLVVWAWLSLAWSIDQSLTVQACLRATLAVMVTGHVACVCPPQRLLSALGLGFALVLGTAVVLGMMAADFALQVHWPDGVNQEHVWRGPFGDKNRLGGAAAFAAMLFLIATTTRVIRPVIGVAGLSLAGLVLFGSGSVGGVMILLMGGVTFVATTLGSRAGIQSTATVPVVVGCVAAVAASLWAVAPDLGEVVGRDATLSGRTAVWRDAGAIALERPLTGFGFGASWSGNDRDPRVGHPAAAAHANAHSGYLQLATDLGLPGLILGTLAVVTALVNGLRALDTWPMPTFHFVTAGVVMFALLNVAEAQMLGNSLAWVTFVILAIGPARKV